MNSFGTIFRLTSFGESHGKGVGGVIDGMPAGVEIDMDFIQKELNRRRPGQSSIVTPRKEGDKVEFLSGIFNGYSTGTPIGFVVYNENQHSSDYDNSIVRPMQIIHISRNTDTGIIEEAVVLRQERRLPGVSPGLWQSWH